MENSNLQIKITNDDEKNGVENLMNNKLGSLPSVCSDRCCIYKIPEFILKGNEEFYRPSVMSIGPIYYQDTKLETMQEVKWIYLNCFLKNPNNAYPSLKYYINYVREKEEEIRGSYQQPSRLGSDQFVEMIVLDAAFLVYYFMCANYIPSFDSPTIENKLQVLMPYLEKDLFPLENQLPYFILRGVYDIAFGDIYKPDDLFIKYTVNYIGLIGIPGCKPIESIIIDGNKITSKSSIKHLVELQRMSSCLSLSLPLRNSQTKTNQTTKSSSVSYIKRAVSLILPCTRLHQHRLKRKTDDDDDCPDSHLTYTAKQLKDAGVTFVASESDNPLDITFADGKLKISRLELNDHTETFLRNLVYFEQCHYFQDSYFIDYIFFLDELIDNVEDVRVLVKNKIFSHHLGSDEDVINLFNNIGKNVNLTCNYYYSNVSRDVNDYASIGWNRWMAILRRKYFNHPWVILSVIAAALLFLLTLLQTIADFTIS